MQGNLLWWVIERRLRRSLPPTHAASTLGDLAEDFAQRRGASGAVRAHLWLIAEARSLRAAYRAGGSSAVSHDASRSRLMLADDMRHAWKRLVARPSMPLLCAALLAVGIGLSTTMFSVVDSLLLRPAPFADADRLVQQSLWRTEPDVMDAWRASGLFDRVEAARLRLFDLAGESTGAITGAFVTSGLFDMLEVRPVRGRLFNVHDTRVGSNEALVLSETIWRSGFGGDAGLIGRRVRFGNESLVVIGIAPSDLRFPTPETVAWRAFDPSSGGTEPATIFGRLVRGMTREDAEERTGRIARALAQLPRGYGGAPPLRFVGGVSPDALTRRALSLLAGGVALVFVALCGNVCGLLLAHLSRRRREFATQTALGASRSRLIRQSAIEHSAICAIGAAAGIALAAGLTTRIPALFLDRTLNVIDIDLRALLAAGALGAATVLVAGLAPAWLGTRAAPADALRGSRQSGGDGRGARLVTRALLTAQIALAGALLIGSGILLRSFLQLASVDRGMSLDGIVRVDLLELDQAFSRGPSMALGTAAIEAQMRTWPEVEAMALSREIPPSWFDARVRVDPEATWEASLRVDRYRVAPAFFELYGIVLQRGRAFTDRDPADAVVISERLAAALWPGRDALGRRLEIAGNAAARVIGVAREIRLPTLEVELDRPEFYVALGSESRTLSASLRCRGSCPAEHVMRERLAAVHPAIVPRERPPIDAAFLAHLELPRAVAHIAGVFAMIAVLTAAGGLFSVMTAAVARRRREFGIRAALGASPAQTRWTVLAGALRLTAVGITGGAAGGWIVAESLSSFHYGVTATDPLSWSVVLAALALASVAAAWRPALEAARVDPVTLLKEE
jgi:putative ABC transport system permease protein